MHDNNFIDVSSELHNVSGGGGRGTAIANGIRRAYNAARPVLRETAGVVKDLGVIGGVAYGARRAWDSLTGGDQPQQGQPAQPQPQPRP